MGKKDVYRQCASALVLRPSSVCTPDGCGEIYEILLVHKPRKKDAWQLPQGGVEEGESIEQAAKRELKEEAGVDVMITAGCSHVYQYDFPASYRRFRPDNVCGQQVHYVCGSVAAGTSVKVDGKEIDAFAWVLPEQLSQYIKRKEYLSLVERLYREATAGKDKEGEGK